jgi:hypothetical protein
MKEIRPIRKAIICLLTALPFACAQNQVDLAHQSRNVDFSGAPSTKPVKTGTATPASCSVGEVFFRTSAAPGQNLYGCTATNTWSPLGTSGAAMGSELGDFAYTKTSASVVTVGANCSAVTPCVYRFGEIATPVTSSATATIGGTPSNDTAYFYLSATNTPPLTVGYSGGETIACSGCLAAPGITGFPLDGSAIPLYSVAISGNVWASTEVSARGIYNKEFIQPQQGIVVSPDPVSGAVNVQIDSTVVPRYFTGAGAPSITCTAGRDFYTDTTNLNLHFCDNTNTWKQANGAGTYTQSFVLARFSTGPGAQSQDTSSCCSGAGALAASGPNSISYQTAGDILAATDWVMVEKRASHTWSGAAGTIDLSLTAINFDGIPAAGTWNLNFYVGCAVPNAQFTYGTATLVTAAPPSAKFLSATYTASGVNLPGSCGPDAPMQFWVQRAADTGGTTAVRPLAMILDVTIRGN